MLRKKLEISTLTEFQCTGGKCPLTCCVTTWGITLREDEVKAYKKIKHPFGKVIMDAIDEKNRLFKGDENNRCQLLTTGGLCKIVQRFGPDALCVTCKFFPREIYVNGDIYEAGVEAACPVVAEKLLDSKLPYFTYDEEEIDKELPEDTDYSMYDSLSPIRNFLIELLLSDNNDNIYGKIFIIIDMMTRLKDLIEKNELTPESSALLLSEYDNEELIAQVCSGMRNIKGSNSLTDNVIFKSLGLHSNIMKKIAVKLIPNFLELDINKYISDIGLLRDSINGLITFTRENCPYFLRNFIINKLFLFFIPKEKDIFGDLMFHIFNELFLIQFVAGIHYGEHNGITLEEYAVIIAKIDRLTAHSKTARELLNKLGENLSAKNYIDMLMF